MYFEFAKFFSSVSFGSSEFERNASFASCQFRGETDFTEARFLQIARFDNAEFLGKTSFDFAQFQNELWFERAMFGGQVSLSRAEIVGPVWFDSATVKEGGTLTFNFTSTEGRVEIRGAKINGKLEIKFSEIGEALVIGFSSFNELIRKKFTAAGSVSLRHTHTKRLVMEGAKFDRVPDFVGMHVDGPVELDFVEIGEEPPEDVRKLPPRERAAELTARWRALKRLAEQGRHHYYTALFARNETRAREPLDREQRPLAARVGRIYGALSDYGLSLWRPWAWWSGAVVVCAVLYWVAYWLSWDHAPFLGCIADEGSTVGAALWRSLRSALVFGGAFTAADFDWARACLFGASEPWPVTLLGIVQSVFSAVLLFLFLLAVRNHFRIR